MPRPCLTFPRPVGGPERRGCSLRRRGASVSTPSAGDPRGSRPARPRPGPQPASDAAAPCFPLAISARRNRRDHPSGHTTRPGLRGPENQPVGRPWALPVSRASSMTMRRAISIARSNSATSGSRSPRCPVARTPRWRPRSTADRATARAATRLCSAQEVRPYAATRSAPRASSTRASHMGRLASSVCLARTSSRAASPSGHTDHPGAD
jgi:hypothetical protein